MIAVGCGLAALSGSSWTVAGPATGGTSPEQVPVLSQTFTVRGPSVPGRSWLWKTQGTTDSRGGPVTYSQAEAGAAESEQRRGDARRTGVDPAGGPIDERRTRSG